jgi:hypothetical protein
MNAETLHTNPVVLPISGAGNTATACKNTGTHLLLVTSGFVDPRNRWVFIRIFLNTLIWGIMDNKFEGEEKVRSSGVTYTIVRPPQLINGALNSSGRLIYGQTNGYFGASGGTARADVAKLCVAALDSEACKNITMEINCDRTLPAQEELTFEGLKTDAERKYGKVNS